ncbi:MAG: YfhO family protein [Phycisphaerae bacterium]
MTSPSELPHDSLDRYAVHPNGRVGPPCIAALIALLFSGHLLLTDDPFLGSGTDIIGMEHPLHAFAAGRLAGGDLPLWNPYHLGGIPFQTGVHGYLSPSFLTAALFEPLFEMKLAIVGHLMLAAAGGAWWASRRVSTRSAAVLVGVTLTLSGFMISHVFAGHRRFVFTLAYLPWVIGLIERAVQRRPHGLALAGLATGLMLLCGHYQVIYIGLLGAGLSIVLERLAHRGRKSILGPMGRDLAVMAAAVGIGLLIAMVQILPMVETLKLSQRSGGGLAFAAGYASRPINLLTLVWPQFFGNMVDAPFFGSWSYWEALAYPGLVALSLALGAVALIPKRQALAPAIIALLGLLLALGSTTPCFDIIVRLVPGAGLFRAAGRYTLLFTVYGSLLAGLALDGLLRTHQPARRIWMLPAGLTVLATAGGIWIFGQSPADWQSAFAELAGQSDVPVDMSVADWRAGLVLAQWDAVRAVILLASVSLLFFFAPRLRRKTWTGMGLVLLAAVDLYGYGHRFLSTGQRRQFQWPVELVALLTEQADPGLRIVDDPALLSMGRGAAWGIGHLGGYDIFVDDAYIRYFNRANGKDPDNFVTFARVSQYSQLHDRLGARFVLSAQPLDQNHAGSLSGFDGWTFRGAFDGVWVYENPQPQPRAFVVHAAEVAPEPRIFDNLADPSFNLTDAMYVDEALPAGFDLGPTPQVGSAESARIVRYEPDRVEIRVHAATPGALVLSDNWHRGWRAMVDGRRAPLIRANRVMRAVPVQAGEHTVVMEFRPTTFYIGASVTSLTLLGGALCLGWRFRPDRRGVSPTPGVNAASGPSRP